MRTLALNWRDWRRPDAGGAEVHLREVLTRLVARGDSVVLVVTRRKDDVGASPEESLDGVRVVRAGTDLTGAWAVPRRARELLAAEPFDVVLDDVNKIPFAAPRWSSVPVVALFHHLFGRQFFREVDPLRAAALWLAERRIGSIYRGTPSVAVSSGTRDELVAAGLRPEDVAVVENGLDHAVYGPGDGRKEATPTAVVVSRLRSYKRVDVAVRAAARVAERAAGFRLVVIGDGPARPRLERLAQRLRAPATFLGHVDASEKVRALRRAHVAVAPSAKEGFGLTVVEAAACGTPVVVSDVPGHRDALADDAVRRFPEGDVAACAARILELLQDPIAAAAYAARARIRAAALDWDRAADEIRSAAVRAMAGGRAMKGSIGAPLTRHSECGT